MAMLRRGLVGEPVRILQEHLGVDADGVFGPATEAALRDYQEQNGLSVDGIAGPDTFTSMGLYELVQLHRPIRGEMVRHLQEALGIDADGIFGRGTEDAVKAYQEQNGLTPDGVVDPRMLAMLGFDGFTDDKVQASLVTEETPVIDLDAVSTEGIEPPPHDPTFVERVGATIHGVEDRAAAIGHSIWTTVKSLF